MSATNWRGLCEELVLLDTEQPTEYADWKQRWNAVIKHARAVLAADADGPAVQSREPASVVGELSYELVAQWMAEVWHEGTPVRVAASDLHLASRAAEWGARYAHQPAPPVEGEVVGPEWRPCVKLPITVHVREQRPGETHVSTREGITPVRPDDLIMRGVQGEEYPIGRELFEKTYRLGPAEPAPPAAGGVGEAALVRRMCEIILGNTFGNEELESLALLVGHHPDVLNASTLPAHALPLPQGEVK